MSAQAPSSAPGWTLLIHVMRARRKRLGLSQRALAQNGGPSFTTIQSIERGATNKIAKNTFAKLDTGLLWPQGTAECLVRAHISAAVEAWDDFISISINDTDQSNKDDLQTRLEHTQSLSRHEELEQLNSYLLFADYGLACVKDADGKLERTKHIQVLETCLHDARSLVFRWLREAREGC